MNLFVYLNNEINWLEVFSIGTFTLLGALGGAFLAGKYSIDVVKKKLAYDRDYKRSEELKSYVKLATAFLAYFEDAIVQAEKFEELLDEHILFESKVSLNTLKAAETSSQAFNKAGEELEKINLTVIPYEYYSDYIVVKLDISKTETIFNSLVKRFDNTTHKYMSNYVLQFYLNLDPKISELRTLHENMMIDYLLAEQEVNTLSDKIRSNSN